MIQNHNHIQIDSHNMEILKEGRHIFDLAAYEGDIHQYHTGFINAHWHREIEIFILIKGKIQIGIGEYIYELQEGDGCFINSDVLHSFLAVVPTPCLYHSFVFDGGIVGGIPGSIFDIICIRPLLEKGPSFLKFSPQSDTGIFFENFNLAFEACRKEYPGYEFDVRNYLSHILLFTKDTGSIITATKTPVLQEKRIKRMLAWIDAHLGEKIRICDIADSVNICPRECQRIFSRYLHYRPMEYVRNRRILIAAQKLAESDIPVTDLALEYGFSSPSHFSMYFREIMGVTPTRYRNQTSPSTDLSEK